MQQRPCALSIAGFDPSSGAGLTADIKTFEQNNVYGFGVCSAITIQNESEFEKVDWMTWDQIKLQLDILFKKHEIKYVKIGLVENLEVLFKIVSYLKTKKSFIVWDPIIKASAGFLFHKKMEAALLLDILKNIDLITPNYPELLKINKIIGASDIFNLISLSGINAVLSKGGHIDSPECNDVLYFSKNMILIKGSRISGFSKHGTGCVLSAALTAQLSLENTMEQSCFLAKKYVEKYILSNITLLGYHSS
jgi:hydroxymethylpyrimidine/phosphomethylpyrimidine kinase